METLPIWFWVFYYIFILLTLITAIISNVKNNRISLAYISIILSFALPLVNFIFSVNRGADQNEFTYVMKEIASGSITAILLTLGYLYLIAWLVLFIKDYFGNSILKLYRWGTNKIQQTLPEKRKQDGA